MAQTAPQSTLPAAPATPAQASSSDQVAEVVVTANKRVENLQRTSIAATVLSGDALVKEGISSATALQNVAPSVKITAVRQQTQVYMRGIGSAITNSNADPAVAINANGIYVPSEMSGAAFFDLERVEVLPGPQGTLYGRNAAGGAINLLTRKPGQAFGGEAYVEGGNYGTLNGFAAVDLPVNDMLAFRVAAISNQHDPYVQGLNGSGIDKGDTVAGRISMLFKPTDRTTIFATASESADRGIDPGDQNNPPAGGNYWKVPVDARALGLYNNYKTDIFTGQIDQKLTDDITLSYLPGYTHINGSQRILLFNTGPATVLGYQDVASTTNELRLSGDQNKFKWLGGLYEYSAKAFNQQLAALPSPVVLTGPFYQNSQGYAAFGQVTYSITDSLRATGGLRYSWDKKSLSGTSGTLLPTGVVSGFISYANSGSNDHVDFKAALEYDLAPSSMVYGSVQTGYNEGGFSTAVASAGSQVAIPYNPATLTAYTIGSKNRFFDRRLQVNLEAFYYDYKNYQVSTKNLLTGQNQIYNAQVARSYGLQLDSRVVITSNDHLDFNMGLLDAVATKLLVPPTGNYSGLTLPFSPTTTLVGGYAHVFDLPGGASLEGEGSARYVSDVWTTFNHAAGTFQPSNTKYDASLTYRPAAARWSVALYGRNLTNKATFGVLSGGAVPGPAAGLIEPPRTYGARVTASF